MEKYAKTLGALLLQLFMFVNIGICQTLNELEIKRLAEKTSQQMYGLKMGNGIIGKECISVGRTLIYQYEVPSNWEAPSNIKEAIINNFKAIGAGQTYYQQNIDVDFYYYKKNILVKKVSVKAVEFSSNGYQLGETISIIDHPKAKGVNIKIKAPLGWEIKEGDRPNIVKKFTNGGNTYLILIKENATFYSRKQCTELFQSDGFLKDFVQGAITFLIDPKVLEQTIVTVGSYPAIQFKAEGIMERNGLVLPVKVKCWIIYYEDRIVFLQSMGLNNSEYDALEPLFSMVTNSVFFPDQYK